MCLLSNQVPKKHLKIPSGRIADTIFFRTLKILTHYMSIAYSDLIGCSYVIQYPYGKNIATDLVPCFLAPDTLLGCH